MCSVAGPQKMPVMLVDQLTESTACREHTRFPRGTGGFWLALLLDFHPQAPVPTLCSFHALMIHRIFSQMLVLPGKVWDWPV